MPSNCSDAWMPANALPSTAAASPVRSCKISRSWSRMATLVTSEETTTTPARTRNVTTETAEEAPCRGWRALPGLRNPGMVPPEPHYGEYMKEYSMLYRMGVNCYGGHVSVICRYARIDLDMRSVPGGATVAMATPAAGLVLQVLRRDWDAAMRYFWQACLRYAEAAAAEGRLG